MQSLGYLTQNALLLSLFLSLTHNGGSRQTEAVESLPLPTRLLRSLCLLPLVLPVQCVAPRTVLVLAVHAPGFVPQSKGASEHGERNTTRREAKTRGKHALQVVRA